MMNGGGVLHVFISLGCNLQMVNVNLGKIFFHVRLSCKKRGEKIISLSLFNAEQIKEALSLVMQTVVVSDEINVDKWEINLGVIPATQFDTLFTHRLKQAFANLLAHEKELNAGNNAVQMLTSSATKSAVLLTEPQLYGEGLFKLALCCLTPATCTILLKKKSANYLQRQLKMLLQHAWKAQEILPVCWYDKVTTSRLSIAAALYLLNNQQGHDWLSQHTPAAHQVTDWAEAITQGEIPLEQVVWLLTGNRPSDNKLPRQLAYSPLLVMRWLLLLWCQPAVRRIIRTRRGESVVEQIDAHLSRCVQRHRNDGTQGGRMYTTELQVVQSRAGAEAKEIYTDTVGTLQPQDKTSLPEGKEMYTETLDAMQPQDKTPLPDGKEMYADTPQEKSPLPEGKEMYADTLGIMYSQGQIPLPEDKKKSAIPRHIIQRGNGAICIPNESVPSKHYITNAGLLLLWPLLPQLFSQFGLLGEERFISDNTQWQAMYCLERLVWGEVIPTDERLILNRLLCGVSFLIPAPQTSLLSVLQQQQIDVWLGAIVKQIAGWQQLSLTDIRQLFLQRPGEINMEGTCPQIIVQSEPYDFLLKDWPWPMMLASYPWAKQPLTIVWSLKGVDRVSDSHLL